MMGDIVFLAHRIPWPPNRGDKIRSWHLLRKLTTLGPVHLACFADDDADLAHRDVLAPLLASIHVEKRTRSRAAGALAGLLERKPLSLSLFESVGIRRFVADKLASHDVDCIFAFSGQMAQFVPDNLGTTRFVMDFVDVDSAKFACYAESATPPMRWIHAREGRKLAAFEKTVAARADASLFVSEAEASLFRARSGLGQERVFALENGVDLAAFDPDGSYSLPAKPGALIVFTGQMDYRPNIDAVIRFAEQSFPAIRAARPDTCFAIVGRKPDPAITALSTLPGVLVTGEVPDVRGWLAAADVVVAPLGIARGVQNKVLEAMAMARAVVASPAAFEGIDAEPGRDLIVANGSVAESEAVLALLANPQRATAVGRAARAQVERRYGWDARLAGLPAIVGGRAAQVAEAAE
ncbi:TIGR03087 family PEP-CTERM/XrtA system glycosyltransferase [Sphingomonas cavernae]|uniref:TIGR03087 family PEP-CTERM/XrtA system glycosyltransferase n=1 Tax=Sphingomonas cavernae TaxID=2320861 RepID=A0A418WN47_9SPHN|nr:TIGR03087 family PEP-CTERM/XrtA system glycosyltransferase [Sphingomonas cavernae]RJF91421.1 TIGR03087 family PEP-CTERM/XrtA system glycosyltransferase [Sphingomonas cavernae]